MNLWVKKLGLIPGLALLFLGCEDPEDVGLELNPDAGKYKSSFVEIPVKVGQIQTEPHLTLGKLMSSDSTREGIFVPVIGKVLLGKSEDPVFGQVTAKGYIQFFAPEDSLDIQDDAQFESLEFGLRLNDFYGADHTFEEEQKFYVYELNENIENEEEVTTSSSSIDLLQPPIGEFTFMPDSTDGKSVSINLPDSLGKRLFETAKNDTLGHYYNDDNFIRFFKGLAIVPDENNSVILEFSPSDRNTFLRFNFNLNNNDTTKTFRKVNAIGKPVRSQHIVHDKTGTPLKSIADDNTANYDLDKLYLKAGVGLMGELNFSDIYEISDTTSGFIVNKAEFLIQEEVQQDTSSWLPSKLNLYIANEQFEFKSLSFSWRQNSFFSFQYVVEDSTSLIGQYKSPGLNLSTYFNSLINNGNQEPVLYIAPSPFVNSVAQTVIDKKNLKLRLHFSYLK